MKKVSIKQDTGKTNTTDYVAEKRSYTPPLVIDNFVDDNGDVVYILENGNTISQLKYDAIWKPLKQDIKPKGYKGVAILPPQRKL